MNTYVLVIACETCDEPMKNRVVDLSSSPGDEPIIDIAMAISQETFTCDNCGGVTYTGDLEDIMEHEAGTEPEEEDDDG